MRNLKNSLCFALFLLVSSINAQVKTTDAFSWLEGQWEKETTEEKIVEVWRRVEPNKYEGFGAVIKKSDTTFKEVLHLIKIGDFWEYIALVGKQNPIMFTLTTDNVKAFIFENKEHDFPQQITYTLLSPLSINVRVGGVIQGKQTYEAYVLQKVK